MGSVSISQSSGTRTLASTSSATSSSFWYQCHLCGICNFLCVRDWAWVWSSASGCCKCLWKSPFHHRAYFRKCLRNLDPPHNHPERQFQIQRPNPRNPHINNLDNHRSQHRHHLRLPSNDQSPSRRTLPETLSPRQSRRLRQIFPPSTKSSGATSSSSRELRRSGPSRTYPVSSTHWTFYQYHVWFEAGRRPSGPDWEDHTCGCPVRL